MEKYGSEMVENTDSNDIDQLLYSGENFMSVGTVDEFSVVMLNKHLSREA